MRTGDLRRRVVIQQRRTTKDAAGQQLHSWVDLLTGVPAAIEPLTGRELMAAQAINSEVTHRITVRWHPLLVNPVKVAAMRLVYRGPEGTDRYFSVDAVMNLDERNRWIELATNEGLAKE